MNGSLKTFYIFLPHLIITAQPVPIYSINTVLFKTVQDVLSGNMLLRGYTLTVPGDFPLQQFKLRMF